MREFVPAFSDRQHDPQAMRSFADFSKRYGSADARLGLLLAAASGKPAPRPSPPPPSPSSLKFVPMAGACRTASGKDGPRIETEMFPVKYSQCKQRCEALSERCDAFDTCCGMTGKAPAAGTDPTLSWCAIWGRNITAADASVCLQGAGFTNATWTFFEGSLPHGRVCWGDPHEGPANTCFGRAPHCKTDDR